MNIRIVVPFGLCMVFAASPTLARVKQPLTKHWGPYTVEAIPDIAEGRYQAMVTVRDAAGHIVKRYKDWNIDQVTIAEVNGHGSPELVVGMRDTSTGFCLDTSVLTRDGGLSTLLRIRGTFSFAGVLHDRRTRRPLLLFDGGLKCDGLAMDVDLYNAASPEAPMVVGWDGQHYVNQSTLFPARSLRTAAKAKAGFLEEGEDGGHAEQALEYYVNMVAAGREAQARRFILHRGDREVRVWFLRNERTMRSIVKAWLRERYS